jgi:hypothetical protein
MYILESLLNRSRPKTPSNFLCEVRSANPFQISDFDELSHLPLEAERHLPESRPHIVKISSILSNCHRLNRVEAALLKFRRSDRSKHDEPSWRRLRDAVEETRNFVLEEGPGKLARSLADLHAAWNWTSQLGDSDVVYSFLGGHLESEILETCTFGDFLNGTWSQLEAENVIVLHGDVNAYLLDAIDDAKLLSAVSNSELCVVHVRATKGVGDEGDVKSLHFVKAVCDARKVGHAVIEALRRHLPDWKVEGPVPLISSTHPTAIWTASVLVSDTFWRRYRESASMAEAVEDARRDASKSATGLVDEHVVDIEGSSTNSLTERGTGSLDTVPLRLI